MILYMFRRLKLYINIILLEKNNYLNIHNINIRILTQYSIKYFNINNMIIYIKKQN